MSTSSEIKKVAYSSLEISNKKDRKKEKKRLKYTVLKMYICVVTILDFLLKYILGYI